MAYTKIVKKLALDSQLHCSTFGKDVQLLILCLSYFATTVLVGAE